MLDYDQFLYESRRYMIRDILKTLEKEGLSSENHFLISFKTDRTDVVIPDFVRAKYPEEITIVLQYQFENLIVNEHAFQVDLAFGGVLSTLTVPYDAITQFADPSQQFGFILQPKKERTSKKEKKNEVSVGQIIDLERYRKK